jgi:hypothetical protein
MDAYLSNSPDHSNKSGTDSGEPLGDTGAHRERRTDTSPHHRQSASFKAFLIKLGAPEVCRRVLDVLEYMESSLLPLLLSQSFFPVQLNTRTSLPLAFHRNDSPEPIRPVALSLSIRYPSTKTSVAGVAYDEQCAASVCTTASVEHLQRDPMLVYTEEQRPQSRKARTWG